MKKLVVSFLALLFAFSFVAPLRAGRPGLRAPVACVASPGGLVSRYSGEGNANDSSGANHGTLQNGTTFAPGEVGQAFNFNSSASNYVRIPDSGSLRPNSLTIEGWVNFNATNLGHAQHVFGKAVNVSNINSYVLWYQDGALHAATGDLQNGYDKLDFPWQPSLGTWYHVAYVFTGSSHSLYVNGAVVAAGSNTHPPGYDSHDVLIGADLPAGPASTPIDFFEGKIDEVGLYNRALSASEIQAIVNAGSAGTCGAPPAFSTDGSLPLTIGASNKLDLGVFSDGTSLAIGLTGQGDLVDSRLQVRPNGELAAPASAPYSFANAGAAYPSQDGGDGINHFSGGGANYDASGSGYPFAGKLTTDTLDPAAIRLGTVVATFAANPTRADWFLIGSGRTITIPPGGAHLYLAVNDTVPGDNHGVYGYTLTTAPPAPPHGGLSQTQFTVNESANPPSSVNDTVLRFRALQSGLPSGLNVRVQVSTNYSVADPASAIWSNLPDATGGLMSYVASVHGYTLNSSSYPAVNGVFFRTISTAPGYPTSISNVVGPCNLTGANQHMSAPLLFVTTNGQNNAIRFGVKQADLPLGIAVWLQTTQTPTKEESWTNAPFDNGGQMAQDITTPDLHQFYLGADEHPDADGIYFRAMASAQGYAKSFSQPYGPFKFVRDPAATVALSVNGIGFPDGNTLDDGLLLPNGSFNMQVNASSGRFITRLTLLLDGITIGHFDHGATSGSLSYTTNIPGDHIVEAYATDDLGVTGAAPPVHVRVLPAAPGRIYQMQQSGSWNDNSNWIDIQGNNGIPGPNDFAIIGSFTPRLTGSVTVKSVSLNGGTIDDDRQATGIARKLTVTGFATVAAGKIKADVSIPSGSTLEMLNDEDIGLSGTLDYAGTVRMHGKGGIDGIHTGQTANAQPNGFFDGLLGAIRGAGQFIADLTSGGRRGSRSAPPPPPNASPKKEVRVVRARRVDLSAGSVVGVPAPLFSSNGSPLIAAGAGNLVAAGAGNLVAAGAGNLVAAGAGNLVAAGAGNLVAAGAGNLVAAGAGNLIATGGGNLIATGGGNLVAAGAGNLVAAGAGNAPIRSGGKARMAAAAEVDDGYVQTGGETNLEGITITGTVQLDGGTLSGSGLILGNLTNNGAVVSPGTGAGAIGVLGDYTQGPNGTLLVENGGRNPTEFDSLLTSGAVTLNGNLEVHNINGYTPDPQDTLNPVGYSSVTGSFSAVSGNAQVSVAGTGALLAVAPDALVLTRVVSRKVHGDAGPFDIVLPSTGSPGVECRGGGANGNHTIVFVFTNNVASGAAAVTGGPGNVIGTPRAEGTTLSVDLTGVTNAQTVTITLNNVTDTASQVLPATSATIGFLLSDVNGDGAVNSGDATIVRNRSGKATDSTNFRADVNADGVINSADATIVRARSGSSLNP